MKLFFGLLCLSLGASEVVKEADAKTLTSIVSFLASDALEGRDTPSSGLTIAAEYIASEFRRAGLKPGPGGTYFQEAKVAVRRVVREGFAVSFSDGTKTVTIPTETGMWSAGAKVELNAAAVRRLSVAELREWKEESVEPVVLLEGPGGPGMQQGVMKLAAAGAKLLVLVNLPMQLPSQTLEFDDQPKTTLVMLRTADKEAETLLKSGVALTATATIAEASSKAAVVRNVIGILPGSDAAMKDEYVVLTAHYDHLGIKPNDEGDKIYNGANDNASGVASIIESARLLGQLPVAPKRSVLFIAFFGEERGLLGSRYLMRHPVLPLKQMVANLNLEQTGRTDSSEGPNVGQANLTGYHFSTIHKHLEEAGKATDLKIVKHEKFNEPYFMASDNAAFAPAGVPSATMSVTYAFTDYHQKGDEWEKIDYANMAKVTRAAAQAVYLMADAPERVVWNADEPKIKGYREAAEKLR